MVAVQLAAHHAEHRAEPAHERCRQRFEHGDLEAAQAARGRDLGADEPGADDHDARRGVEATHGSRARRRRVRSTKMPSRSGVPGSVRGVAPVASTRPSNASALAVVEGRRGVRRGRGSRPACPAAARGRDRRTAARRSARSSGSHSPARSCFDSGGRSYGRCGSAPTRTSRPSKPSRRRVSVARSPASEAPTTATVSTPAHSRRVRRPPSSTTRRPGRASTLVQGGGQGSMLRRLPGRRPRALVLVDIRCSDVREDRCRDFRVSTP